MKQDQRVAEETLACLGQKEVLENKEKEGRKELEVPQDLLEMLVVQETQVHLDLLESLAQQE